MDLAIGILSFFWDPVFPVSLFPLFAGLAFWVRRRPEIVFPFFLIHSLAFGRVDVFHFVLFCAFSLIWYMDKFTPHLASHVILAGIFTTAYWMEFGWIQGTVSLVSFGLALLRRVEGEG